MTPLTVQATYKRGHVVPEEPERIAEWKVQLEEGAAVAVTFELWSEARTRRQQALLHELLGRYAREIGESLQSLKDRIKVDLGFWLPADKILLGELDPPTWRGKFVDLHAFYPELHAEMTLILLRSEADYTKHMEGEFVDRVIYECQENHVDIEDILQTLSELSNE